MRTVLTIGALTLGLVVLLNLDAELYERTVDPTVAGNPTELGGTPIRIFSAGLYLQAASFERRSFSEAIIIDGELLTSGFAEQGLRVAFFKPGTRERAYGNYDLAGSGEDLALLRERLAAAPLDTCVAMSVFRTIQPTDGDDAARAAALDELFSSLGAQCRPHEERFASWAFLAARRPEGWHPLAESFSVTRGVGLSFQVSRDLARYDPVQPAPLVDTGVVHALTSPYRNGETRLDPFTIVRRGNTAWFEINGVALDGIQAAPPFGSAAQALPHNEGRVRWSFVRLGHRPEFRTLLGIADWHAPHCKGLEFQVWVNGQEAATRRLAGEATPPGSADSTESWVPWSVDLSAWSNQWVTLELRTRQTSIPADSRALYLDPAIWGKPQIVYEASPAEVQPPARDVFIDLFDRNRDGILMRDEIGPRVQLFDRDKNGLIELQEVPQQAREFLTEMDADGDGSISTADFESWYDQKSTGN